MRMTTGNFRWTAPSLLFSTLLLTLLLPTKPAFAALPGAAGAAPVATAVVHAASLKLQFDPSLLRPAHSLGLDDYLRLAPQPPAGRWRLDFNAPAQPGFGEQGPGVVLQRGEYRGNGYALLAELGDIRISESPNQAPGPYRKGGRLALSSGTAAHAVRLESFAATGASGDGSEEVLVGASGEMSFLADAARLKTTYLSVRDPEAPWRYRLLDSDHGHKALGARKGDVLGVVAVWQPFQERLSARAEFNLAAFDRDTTDDSAAVRDSAYRVKLAGAWSRCRYSALYEHTGPEYRIAGGGGPRRDWQGVALGLQTGFDLHAVDLKLSRYNDNTGASELKPRLYRYEAVADYTFTGLQVLPLGLQYRKTFIDSVQEPVGFPAQQADEDAVSGRANYLAGKWDLGMQATLSQRTDRVRGEREASAATIAFSPRFKDGAVALVPDFSLKRANDFLAGVSTDQYALNLGINGSALERKLDYQVRGGFRKVTAGLPAYGKESLGAQIKAAYPLAKFFKWTREPSIGIKGEYNGTSNAHRSDSDFSLLLSVEGGSFL